MRPDGPNGAEPPALSAATEDLRPVPGHLRPPSALLLHITFRLPPLAWDNGALRARRRQLIRIAEVWRVAPPQYGDTTNPVVNCGERHPSVDGL